ncbi:Retrovirus-related Pol polyprotein from transposon RE1 [Vitis vinifera]|uniref:Retrovirus-related Pol polyprotein from transposon RE1 n=1 Tax=Vitis vinifera TaxID=29760 RepID=A0A438H2Q5_VITVI|nr:Retrovirus-related Pol polyprotein from transposon RE1 [Vitis vinifera]
MSAKFDALLRTKLDWLLKASTNALALTTLKPSVQSSNLPFVRLVLSLAVSQGWSLRQLDVNNAFLQGTLTEDVFMSQPPGFIDRDHPHHVCKLRKAIYGLKQAPRAWYHELRQFLLQFGFINSIADTSLFIFNNHGTILYLLVYVDDIIITGNNVEAAQTFIQQLSQRFSLKDLGPLTYFLGVEVTSHTNGLFLSQRKYIADLLNRTHMTKAKLAPTPLATSPILTLQSGTPLSDPTEYRTVVVASSVSPSLGRTLPIRNSLDFLSPHELGVTLPQQPVIYCDNVGATHLCSNPVFHSCMKHVALDYHFIREQVQNGLLRVSHISASDQLADALIKPLARPQFDSLKAKIGLAPRSSILRGHDKDIQSISYFRAHAICVYANHINENWERELTWPCKSEGNELEVSMDTGLGRVVRKGVVMGTWCGVEREKVVKKKMRELGIEGERWTGEEWVGIQTWKVCMGMRVVICMGIGGDGYACWVGYMSMEGVMAMHVGWGIQRCGYGEMKSDDMHGVMWYGYGGDHAWPCMAMQMCKEVDEKWVPPLLSKPLPALLFTDQQAWALQPPSWPPSSPCCYTSNVAGFMEKRGPPHLKNE